jgi:hypothetical protein
MAPVASFRGLGASQADAVYAITAIFGVPLLVAGAMITPQGLHLGGLITYTAIMLVLMPISGWYLFATEFLFPPAGSSRLGAVVSFWIGGTLTAVAGIFWIYAVLGYPPPHASVDPVGHLLIPFMPRAGLAIGLFCLSMLVSSGWVGAIAAVLRPEVAIRSAVIGGVVLFVILYGAGWLLVLN